MKIIVTNAALSNAGDAAIMLGTCAILRRTFGQGGGPDIAVRDQQPENASKHFPEFEIGPVLYSRIEAWLPRPRFRKVGIVVVFMAAALWRTPLGPIAARLLPRPIRRELAAYAAADVVISAGGTYLVPHYRLTPKLVDLMVARLLGRPYVLFTQSLGPFDGIQDKLLKPVLHHARHIFVRDGKSRRHLADFGVRAGRVTVCADAAFALDGRQGQEDRGNESPRIAISVRDWPHFSGNAALSTTRYREAIATLAQHLIRSRGAAITFISTCQGVEGYWTDDSRVAEDILIRIPPALWPSVTIDSEFHRPEDMVARLSAFDLIVATRMHVAIMGLTAGVPVLPIAYEFKTRELFDAMGQSDMVMEMDTVSANDICKRADAALDDLSSLREQVAAQSKFLSRSAYQSGPILKKSLEHTI